MDELQKIASEAQPSAKEKAKKWAKNTLIVAAGSGVGAGLGTLADEVGRRYFGQTYKALSPKIQNLIIGAFSAGGALAANKLMEEASKREH